MELGSYIAITSDFEEFRQNVEQMYGKQRVLYFFEDSFLVEHAKAVVKEAYIAEKETKVLVLGAKSYNTVAQNSLLKIIEEPPNNIVFILCVASKAALLPTIRSRLVIKSFDTKKELPKSGLNFAHLSLSDIFEFLQSHKNISKQELQELIEVVSVEALKSGVKLQRKDLELFEKLYYLASLNSRPYPLLTAGMVSIFRAKNAQN